MLTLIFMQIIARSRSGESNLIDVDIKVEFQSKHGKDYELYRNWADFHGNNILEILKPH